MLSSHMELNKQGMSTTEFAATFELKKNVKTEMGKMKKISLVTLSWVNSIDIVIEE